MTFYLPAIKMLTSKVFLRKTKRGNILKVMEIYMYISAFADAEKSQMSIHNTVFVPNT